MEEFLVDAINGMEEREVPVIEIENITKKFGKTKVFENICLNFFKGKIYGIVGHNGSGKTVLFKCICGLLLPEEGSINIHGKKLEGMLSEAGIIIENPAFLSGKTGRKNLELLYMLRHKRDIKYIEKIMIQVGLDPMSKKPVKNYSLGMRQRLAIAQAIMEDPEILILDEPMNGLDKNGIQEVREMLLRLKAEGKTIILASHNKEDIEVLCDEVYEMEKGCIKLLR